MAGDCTNFSQGEQPHWEWRAVAAIYRLSIAERHSRWKKCAWRRAMKKHSGYNPPLPVARAASSPPSSSIPFRIHHHLPPSVSFSVGSWTLGVRCSLCRCPLVLVLVLESSPIHASPIHASPIHASPIHASRFTLHASRFTLHASPAAPRKSFSKNIEIPVAEGK